MTCMASTQAKSHSKEASKEASKESEKTPSCLSSTAAHAALQELYVMFFSKENLLQTMKILCTCKTTCENDKMTAVVTQLCTSHVQIKFTEQGYVPFFKCPLLVIPFTYMTKQQILGIKNIITNLAKEQETFRVSSMMGGGASITCLHSPARIIDPAHVLFTLYCLLQQHCKDTQNLHMIYNTIVQRLTCNINLSREHIARARDDIKAYTRQSMEAKKE